MDLSTKLRALFESANEALDVEQLAASMRQLAESVCAQWQELTEEERLSVGAVPPIVLNAGECLRALDRMQSARAARDADAAALNALWAVTFAFRMEEGYKITMPSLCPACGSTRLEMRSTYRSVGARCMDCENQWFVYLPFFPPQRLSRE